MAYGNPSTMEMILASSNVNRDPATAFVYR